MVNRQLRNLCFLPERRHGCQTVAKDVSINTLLRIPACINLVTDFSPLKSWTYRIRALTL